ncbi:formin-like protein 7 [Oryza sativa Japonica Group]|uniref:Os02g0518000 protein n=3 Tax=Oryza TaxID=4527 RepID=Q0E0W1_ORYSJ|nr:formin-like protein 16 [Oryza sativa Japonica Group]KAF2945034.1 hypothetical protein DAI22_02g187400 [Oryza sativa Japonica Group]BAD26323.1 unknown protein [Oryza sativa Japonica Group]BAD38562.1 unknown protein [Oryza sativa Japonica Group]BAF08877.1 Os02g0518000 [Oryza sativa Japonica Group]BAG90843.1 unnamed protein product [Oryza sativa Japonica Group]|eukprot:NP_001046963.1 Os02g0518000 [Oryza sativa Japonica Group]
MDHRWWPRRRPEPAAIDITWVSCRGVRSSVPFHTPCLYASIYLHHPSPSPSSCGRRRPHRVKTATDRAGGGNPEWDAPLRLYLPSSSSSSPATSSDNKDEVLLRFELKSEVAVLGDVLSATAAVPVSELVADGATRRVSYQLAGPDGKHPNGVISFSYAVHAAAAADTSSSSPSSDADDDRRSTTTTTTSGSECDEYSITPPRSAASRAITLPPPPPSSTMYPAIDWPPTEQLIPMLLYPPAKPHTTAIVKGSTCYPPPPPPSSTPPVEPVAVFPPPPSPACGVYYPPPTVREPVINRSGMYPKVDLDIPVSCYPPPPTAATMYGGGCGYAAAPEWDGRWLHG